MLKTCNIKPGDKQSMGGSATGKRSSRKKTICEDIIYINEDHEIKFFGLADGQTGKTHCREGGKDVLRAVFSFIRRKGITQMIQYKHVDELQYELIKTIRETVSSLSLSLGVEEKEFSSTLVIFAYEPLTGNYVFIHLGDGGIIARKKDGEIIMLSAPENGLTASHTWLTTSQGALLHLRIGFGCIHAFKRIMMITDGATIFAHGKNISETTKKLIKNGSKEDIISCLVESDPIDDASCIVIDPTSETVSTRQS